MFKLFNIYHFIYIVIFILIFFVLNKLFKNKGKDLQYKIIYFLSIINFLIHFIKVYLDIDLLPSDKIYQIALTNLCAVNVIFYPFVLKKQNELLMSFFSFIGLFSGIVSMLFCYGLNNTFPFIFF